MGSRIAQAPKSPPADSSADEGLLRMVIDAVPALVAYYQADTMVCRLANARYADYNGHSTASILGLTVEQAIGEAAWQTIQPHVTRCLQGHEVRYKREQTLPDGTLRMIEVNLLPHLDSAGAVLGAFVLINDITEQWRAERAVRLSEERMRKFSQATSEAVVFHRYGTITDGNEALQSLLGYPLSELLGQPTARYVVPRFRGIVVERVRQHSEHPYEAAMLHRDGHEVPVEIVGRMLPQQQGACRVAVLRDLRPHKAAQQRASHLARHDALTQLPNRRHLLEWLNTTVAGMPPQQQGPAGPPLLKTSATATPMLVASEALPAPVSAALAVLLLDLDHFKAVNDSLGHAAGDAVLCLVAERLRAAVPLPNMVAHLGSDQFAVVLVSPLPCRPSVGALADQLLQTVCQSMTVGETVLSLSPSIGIALYPDDGADAGALVRSADAALHQAKDMGRGNRQFFERGMASQASELLQQEHLLREAVAQSRFVLHYQPQVRLCDGALVGMEALVRWQHPERGLVGPDSFIAMAESRGLIAPIGRWVMHEACRQTRAWQDAGLAVVPVAVNLSALEFRQRDMVTQIAAVLQRTGLAPQWLEIELTESALMHPLGAANETLQALKALGVRLSIDDFGTGYSSLAYLKRYPIDKLKIDRSFVIDTPGNSDDVAIVTAIVQMARSLGLQTVAEGVETPAQMDWLRSLGCNLAQGYTIARPMDADRMCDWLASNAAAPLEQATSKV